MEAIPLEMLPGPLGAIVRGLDLRRPLPAQTHAGLLSALDQHLLLVFRGQSLSPAELERFASGVGPPVDHPHVQPLDERVSVTEIRKEPHHEHNFGGAWHFDLSFLQRPPMATVLHAKEVPQHGGDTVWSNQCLAYDNLPCGLRERIDGVFAEHTSTLAFRDIGQLLSATHALAPLHPRSGRRHLYANPVSIAGLVGWDEGASKCFLGELYAHATAESWQYRHRWRVGDVIVWDNLACMHKALNDYHGHRRVMHRIAVGAPGN